jgi:pyridoxine 4-dehydrogenase
MNKKTGSPLAGSSGTVSLGGELTVHRLGFGAMRITGDGIWGPPKDPASALAVLRRATELGVNFIDTADSYGPYVSEELIAKALAPYPKDLVIATKGGWNRPGPGAVDPRRQPGAPAQGCRGQLKEVAPGSHRCLPIARSRPRSTFRRVGRNPGRVASRREDSFRRAVQCD